MEKRDNIAPLILGIIASVLMLPSIACNVVCAMFGSEVSSAGDALEEAGLSGAGGLGGAFFGATLVIAAAAILACVLGFVAAIKSRGNMKIGGMLFLVTTILIVVQLVVSFMTYGTFTDYFAMIACVLYIISLIVCFMEAGKQNAPQ